MRSKKIKVLLTVLLLAFVMLIPSAVFADGERVVIAASNASKVLIEPQYVNYVSGQTLKDLLLSSPNGHVFTFQASSDFIIAVDSVEGAFNRFANDGSYELQRPVSEIESFFLVNQTLELTEEKCSAFSEMIKAMADFNASVNGVKNYKAAKTAYENAMEAFFDKDADFSALANALKTEMQGYVDNVLNAKKYSLNLSFTNLNHAALSSYEICFSDDYGNRFLFTQGDEIKLIPGDYHFELTQEGNLHTSYGELTVVKPSDDSNASVNINGSVVTEISLYTGANWIDSYTLHSKNGGDTIQGTYAHDGNTWYIPDYESNAYIYLDASSVIGETGSFTYSNVTVFPVYTNTYGIIKGDSSADRLTWEATNEALVRIIDASSKGNSAVLEARYNYGSYTIKEAHELVIERSPSLKGLNLYADGVLQDISFSKDNNEYTVKVASDSIEIEAAPFDASYEIKLNGQVVSAKTEMPLTNYSNEFIVTVSSNGNTNTYKLAVIKSESIEVKIAKAAGISSYVENSAGGRIGASSASGNYDVFKLVAGEKYFAVFTKNEYFHLKEEFTASDGLVITSKTPVTDNWLSELAAQTTPVKYTSTKYYLNSFSSSTHEYTIVVPDSYENPYFTAKLVNGLDNAVITLVESGRTLVSGDNYGKLSTNVEKSDKGSTITVRVSSENGNTINYQDYIINVNRSLTIKSAAANSFGLNLKLDGDETKIYQVNNGVISNKPVINRDIYSYAANILRSYQKAVIKVEPFIENAYVKVLGSEYRAYVNPETGEKNSFIEFEYTLDSLLDSETIDIVLCSDSDSAIETSYTVALNKKDAVKVNVDVKDAGTNSSIEHLVCVYDMRTNERIWNEQDGSFKLVDSLEYRIVTTAYGYVGDSRIVTISASNKDISIKLSKAPASPSLIQLDSSWPSFRGSDDANGVVSFKTPVADSNAMLSWAAKLGDGYSAGATGCPILITDTDGYEYLITYAGNYIYKIDAISGVTVASGRMDHSSSFAINSPTYAEGMIFVGLSDGCVQAFNASTMESIWLYRDALGGQPNCPITYSNGYVYTGFWNSELKDANFVCISVTDEDPGNTKEEKLASWTYTSAGGFYWAGAYADPAGNFILVPTDDGDSAYLKNSAKLLCLNPKTGEILDTIEGIVGDARCSVSYDKVSDRFFFTSKGGYFYSVKVSTEDGVHFDMDSFRSVALDNGGNNPETPAMSTCTPVIYNNRAYIGVSGVSQFGAYSGHNITVIDLTSWTVAYSLPTQGYPQTSGLLTTAYEGSDGYVYVYFIDNYTPGKLRVLKDNPTTNRGLITTTETFTDKGVQYTYNTAYVLFTPYGAQAQYAICSPIADSYGTLYFKNDSAFMMALSNTITSMEVTKNPDKMDYLEGESFDPAGMEITITYSNGLTRTLPYERTVNGKTIEYFKIASDELQTSDEYTFIEFAYAMYQNKNGNAGTAYVPQAARLGIKVSSSGSDKCLMLKENAVLEHEVTQGALYQIKLSDLVKDSEKHAISYTLSGDFNDKCKIENGILYLTYMDSGKHSPVLICTCSEGSLTVNLEITVSEAFAGLDVQYNYDETDLKAGETVTVYVTVSSDGVPIYGTDKDGNYVVMAHLPVEIGYYDLANSWYGDLSDFYRYETEDGRGGYVSDRVIKRPTAMHLYLKLLEDYTFNAEIDGCIYNMFDEEAYEISTFSKAYITGGATSTYYQNFWYHDENLMYYRNHCYPLMSPGWGSTSDYMLLSDGDTIDIAMFTNWNFYHYGAFTNFDKNQYTVKPGENLTITALEFSTSESTSGQGNLFRESTRLVYVPLYDSEWNEVGVFEADETGHSFTLEMPTTPGTYYVIGFEEAIGTSDASVAPANAMIIVEEPEKSVVTVSSMIDGTTASVADLQGGGLYAAGETAHLVAPNKTGFTFKGWMLGDTIVSTSNNYDVIVEADADYIAVYEAKAIESTFTLKVYAQGGYRVNGSKKYADYSNSLPSGKTVKLEYTGSNEFLYWKNESGYIVSTDKVYEFVLVSNTSITPVSLSSYAGAEDTGYLGYVEFVTYYGQVLSSDTWNSKDPVSKWSLNNPPLRNGYSFLYWSMDGETEATVADILAEIRKGTNHIKLTPVYVESGESVSVTIKYMDKDSGTELGEKILVRRYGESVTYSLRSFEKPFVYWSMDMEGESVLGYTESIKLRAYDGLTVYAQYSEKDYLKTPSVNIVAKNSSTENDINRVSFTSSWSVPEGYHIESYGMIRTTTKYDENDLVIGAPNVKQYNFTDAQATGIYSLNINIGDKFNTVVYARAYITVRNEKTQVITTYYSPMEFGSYNSLK